MSTMRSRFIPVLLLLAAPGLRGEAGTPESESAVEPALAGAVSVEVSPARSLPEGRVTVSWSSSDVESVRVEGPQLSSTDTQGSKSLGGLSVGTHVFRISARKGEQTLSQEATVTVVEGELRVLQIPNHATAWLAFASPVLEAGAWTQLHAQHSSGFGQARLTGTDGTVQLNPPSSVTLHPRGVGVYTFTLTVTGTVRLSFSPATWDELWIERPSGHRTNITTANMYDTPESGPHTLRQRVGDQWVSQRVMVGELPIATAQATLTVLPPRPDEPPPAPPQVPAF